MDWFIEKGGKWVLAQAVLFGLFFAVWWIPIVYPFLLPTPPTVLIIAGFFIWCGGIQGIWAFVSMGNNISPFPKPKTQAVLVTNGIFDWVRHPIYGAITLLMLGLAMLQGNLLGCCIAIATGIFFYFKANFEETYLVKVYEGYSDYKNRTPKRMFPQLW